uniref:Coiled-coil domain-containing protein 51 n=1 Tax=Steinernema glaseri TaxID=37863 RepID=A0A1I7ZBJ3_9BILA
MGSRWLVFGSRRFLTTTSIVRSSVPVPTAVQNRMDAVFQYYEDVIGLTAVKEAQNEVVQCEEILSAAQLSRRNKQYELRALHSRLEEIHAELNRTSRGEDKYLHLLTEEHATMKKERKLLEEFELVENKEREAFHNLSSKVRSSHEKERERAERTKYWSVTASLIGAVLGIVGTSIGNELRMRHIREMIPSTAKFQPVLDQVTKIINEEQIQINKFIVDMKEILRFDSPQVIPIEKAEGTSEQVVKTIEHQHSKINEQLEELKRLIQLDKSLNVDPAGVVYVGNDMEVLLNQTAKDLESKLKLQTLVIVTFGYAAIAFSIPFILSFFR